MLQHYMCGRVVYDYNESIRKYLSSKLNVVNYEQMSLQPTFNAAPGSFLPVIYQESLVVRAGLVEWGFVPTWDKERKIKLANARVESIESKSAFKNAFREKRCIVPITGYYEWRIEKGLKQPYYIHSITDKVLTLAGLYDNNSFTIITTEAFGPMKDLHERMPLILDPAYWDTWLENSELQEGTLDEIISRANENTSDLEFYKVDRAVNSVVNNRRELINEIR